MREDEALEARVLREPAAAALAAPTVPARWVAPTCARGAPFCRSRFFSLRSLSTKTGPRRLGFARRAAALIAYLSNPSAALLVCESARCSRLVRELAASSRRVARRDASLSSDQQARLSARAGSAAGRARALVRDPRGRPQMRPLSVASERGGLRLGSDFSSWRRRRRRGAPVAVPNRARRGGARSWGRRSARSEVLALLLLGADRLLLHVHRGRRRSARARRAHRCVWPRVARDDVVARARVAAGA